MPRIKKRQAEEPQPVVAYRSRELPETLTAGRSRRTIKPNPKYMNDEMLVPTGRNTVDENDMSGEEEYIVDYEENDDPEDSGLVVRRSVVPSTPQTDGQPKRRGRPPKAKPIDAPRTEPVKNLRKEVLKKLDYKTISISKSRHMGSSQQLVQDGRRKLNLTMDSVDTDSADQDEMDDMDMDQHSLRSRGDSADRVNRTQKVLNPAALKRQTAVKMVDHRGSTVNKSSIDSKTDGTTEDDEYEDEDDEFLNDSDAKMSEVEQPMRRTVGRPRKHPAKQISPFGGKVLLPGMKTSPVASTPVLKRKAAEMGEETKPETQQSKMLRRAYGLKSVNEPTHQSRDAESDDNYDPEEKKFSRSGSFQALSRGRPAKYGYPAGAQSIKSEKTGGAAPMANRSLPDAKLSKPSPTITIVNVSDIMKMRSKSSSDIRRRLEVEEFDSEDVSEQEDVQTDVKQEDGKTHNQLVASILERKRPISLEHLQKVRRHIRDTPTKGDPKGKQRARTATDMFNENEVVDFEDVLQKNIVSADRDTRQVTVGAVRGRGRPPVTSKQDENYSYAAAQGKRGTPNSMAGRVATGTMRRSLQPPRILNATMKLGDNRPRSKQSGGSGDNHYSIDLTDPDNNVKLVASSNENVPVKRTPAGPAQTVTVGQKATGNLTRSGTVASAAVMRDSNIRSSPQEVKKKRVTLYETWNVLHIKSIDSSTKPPHLAMSMISLGNVAADIEMPSDAWSFRTLLEKRKVPVEEGDEVFTGKIPDATIDEADKSNYEPGKVMFRRKAVFPGKFNVQFDRTVTFRNDTYTLNVDGQCCKLMGAPDRVVSIEDIETLLEIIDQVDLKHSCVEVIGGTRVREVANSGMKRVVASKDPIIM